MCCREFPLATEGSLGEELCCREVPLAMEGSLGEDICCGEVSVRGKDIISLNGIDRV